MVKFPFKRYHDILVIETGKVSLKIAHFSRSASGLELLDYCLARLDHQRDNAGQIISLTRAFLNKYSLSPEKVILSIADTGSIAIKYCLLPALKQKEILSAAKWQLKDEVPFNLDHAYCDWQIVKEFTDGEGARHQGVIFAFSRKEAVEEYLSCLKQCNLQAPAIVTNAFNYSYILRGIAQNKHFNSEIVLDLEYMDSALNLYIDKKLYFTRYLPVSVDSFTRSLTGVLFSDKGKAELTLSEAEEIRDNVGIPQDETVFIRDNLHASQIASLIRPVLESLVREIKHSITYFIATLGEPPPQIIYITGLGVNLKNLDTYLEKELGFTVKKLSFPDILNTSRIGPAKLAKDYCQVVSCVGATLSAAAGINLSSRGRGINWMKHGWVKHLIPLLSAIGAFILSLMLISLLMLSVYSYRLKKAKDYFKNKKQLFSFFEKNRSGGGQAFEISLQRVPADALLNFISRCIPDGLRLNELELDQYRGELTLQGEERQAGDAEIIIKKLMDSGFFSWVEPLGQSVTSKVFKIKCKLTY